MSRVREVAIHRIAELCERIHAERVLLAQDAAALVGRVEVAEAPDFRARAEALLEDEIAAQAESALIGRLSKQLEAFR